jgi:hypothetical protein
LVEKFGVIKDIPEREIEEKEKEARQKKFEEPADVNLPEMLLKIERIDGRLDALNEFKNAINERITQLAEEIGELRSTILERDKVFSKLEGDFEKTLEMVQVVEPEKVRNEIENFERQNIEIAAKIERIENLSQELSKENKQFRDLMDKIKSFENLVNISTEIQNKISKIEDAKKYSDALASKVESIFSEMNVKMSDFESHKDKMNKVDELTIELVKMLDEISIKLSKFAEKEKLDKLENDMRKLKIVKEKVSLEELSNLKLDIRYILDTLTELKFVELLSVLPHVKDESMKKDCVAEINEIVKEMKNKKVWDEDKERILRSFA